ncbi:MAG: class I SAM-dependent methyltransferase [bacterium]|nr:class I SAM-dependent methyltransferase [bacterium]
MINKDTNTGWGGVASWYDDLLETGSSYQKDVILPDLMGILSLQKGERVLDLACGQGFFARAFKTAGAEVVGADISHELIDIAKNYEKAGSAISYFIAPSHKLDFLQDNSIDKITIVLALQNIEDVTATFKECSRVLKSAGTLVMVLNHPAFRIPQESAWGFDDKKNIQYRRVDKYMSEFKVSINMHPGEDKPVFTPSFHRPLQYYFKALKSSGFLVRTLHELISNKTSVGKRAQAENQSRNEIPMFMTIEAVK